MNALNIIHKTKTKYCFLFFDFQFMMHPVESQGRGSELMPKWKSEQLLGLSFNIFGIFGTCVKISNLTRGISKMNIQ